MRRGLLPKKQIVCVAWVPRREPLLGSMIANPQEFAIQSRNVNPEAVFVNRGSTAKKFAR
jgi:hypothetical protein